MDAQGSRFLPGFFEPPGRWRSLIPAHPHLPLLHVLMVNAQVRWDVAEHMGVCHLLRYAGRVCVEVRACECVHSPVCVHTTVRG